MPYYNTNNLSGQALKDAVILASNQQEAVMAIMSDGFHWKPSRVWRHGVDLGRNWLLTSVRRAMSDLAEEGKLEKTDHMSDGPYGKPEHLWRRIDV